MLNRLNDSIFVQLKDGRKEFASWNPCQEGTSAGFVRDFTFAAAPDKIGFNILAARTCIACEESVTSLLYTCLDTFSLQELIDKVLSRMDGDKPSCGCGNRIASSHEGT